MVTTDEKYLKVYGEGLNNDPNCREQWRLGRKLAESTGVVAEADTFILGVPSSQVIVEYMKLLGAVNPAGIEMSGVTLPLLPDGTIESGNVIYLVIVDLNAPFIDEHQKLGVRSLLVHELTHVKQLKKHGITEFYRIYGDVQDQDSYYANPMEQEAYEAGFAYCRKYGVEPEDIGY